MVKQATQVIQQMDSLGQDPAPVYWFQCNAFPWTNWEARVYRSKEFLAQEAAIISKILPCCWVIWPCTGEASWWFSAHPTLWPPLHLGPRQTWFLWHQESSATFSICIHMHSKEVVSLELQTVWAPWLNNLFQILAPPLDSCVTWVKWLKMKRKASGATMTPAMGPSVLLRMEVAWVHFPLLWIPVPVG